MRAPFITVLLDTYNHSSFIGDAMTSVLEQDFPMSDVEVLVVDDGSTDRTPEIVRKFEPRVRLLRKPNGGQASAFNAAISEAHGEIVAFLDGDDWWERKKLERVAAAFAAHPSVGIVGHGITEVTRDGVRLERRLKQETAFQCDSPAGAKIFRTRKNFLGTSRMAIRSSLVRRIFPIPEALVVEADEYLFTMAAVLSRVVILTDVLTFYRLHSANLFQIADGDSSKARQKLAILTSLWESLSHKLETSGIPLEVARLILETIEMEAKQIRLALENRPPWETMRMEWRLLQIHHEDASRWQRAYTAARLLPAAFLPSKTYYQFRQRLVGSRFYRALRGKLLPFPSPAHSQRDETA
ncbi:MAG TPA: glycosyltransferase [Candidatus Acidoferrales bacterium]|nr:glycosyltransferase [Candidatus Acidoferrales bacterium]